LDYFPSPCAALDLPFSFVNTVTAPRN